MKQDIFKTYNRIGVILYMISGGILGFIFKQDVIASLIGIVVGFILGRLMAILVVFIYRNQKKIQSTARKSKK